MSFNFKSKDDISNLVEVLAIASFTGIGFALGGTMGAQFVQGIGINLTTSIFESGYSKFFKERWMSSGAYNHDIQKALSRASIKVLAKLEKECIQSSIKDIDKKDIKDTFTSLKAKINDELPTYIEEAASDKNILNYLNGDLNNAAKQIWDSIDYQHISSNNQELIKKCLVENYLLELRFFFIEELKTDNRDSNKAWRAFQIMLLEGFQQEVKSLQSDISSIRDDLKKLDEIIIFLKQSTDERIQNGLLKDELDTIIQNLLKNRNCNNDKYVEDIQNRFLEVISNCSEKNKEILIVGDVMLDCHINGSLANLFDSQRHVKTRNGGGVYTVEEYEKTLGGAAHIALLFSEIAKVTLIGVIGSDEEGRKINEECICHDITFKMTEAPEIETTTKIYIQRFNDEGTEPLIRFDRENITLMKDYCEHNIDDIIKNIDEAVKDSTDCILIKDNQKGMISKKLVDHVSEISKKWSIPVYVDPKYEWEIFKEAKIESIFPNMKEAACGLYPKRQKSKIIDADNCCALSDDEYHKLLDEYNSCCNNIVIKAGSKGAVIVSGDSKNLSIESIKSVIVNKSDFKTDVGCGDVFDTFAIIGMIQELSLKESILFANFIAGIHTKKPFLEIITLKYIKEELKKNSFKRYILSNITEDSD